MTANPTGIAIVHPLPGQPIEVMVWGPNGVKRELISDKSALRLAADLVAAVLSNEGSRNAH
jgi:hypothetical protein